jgi:hypothetical protein
MDSIEEYERNGLTVTIFRDDDPESPREWDNVGTMICAHRNYNLGDEQFDPDKYDGWEDFRKHLIEDEGAVVILPLYLYDHSGISMYTTGDSGYRQHEAWDSGQVGLIYTDEAMITSYFGEYNQSSLELAEKLLRQEVATYDQYLTGDVYGFEVTNPKTGEDIDSCWGIYGLDDVREEANRAADCFKHPHDAAYAKNARQMHG